MAASRFLATTSYRAECDCLGGPIGGLRRCPQTSKALRPRVVLLVDSSMIGYFTASGRHVSLLRRMSKSPSSEYALHRSVICGTWSCASCDSTALKAPHVAVISCVGW